MQVKRDLHAMKANPLEYLMNNRKTEISTTQRRDRLIKERVHDPYKADAKLPEPTRCVDCKAVYAAGRWQWLTEDVTDADETLCPACRRIRERVPAGILTLSGDFFSEHRDDVMNILYKKVDTEKSQHPLKRLMALEDQTDGSVVATFTDTHLPRGVGKAIERAYEGSLDIQYTKEASLVRVFWQR